MSSTHLLDVKELKMLNESYDNELNNSNNEFNNSYNEFNNSLYSEDEKKLLESINDLNIIQTNLLDIVKEQDEQIETISDNLILANDSVQTGTQDLEIAQKYYFSYKPIFIGLLVGAVALGPVGALLNVKFGSIFTLAGSAMGGYTGYKIQK